MFQSHNGAIAAYVITILAVNTFCVSIPQWCDCCRFRVDNFKPLGKMFQSHNGAIAAKVQYIVTHAEFPVSIPQWCDCCWARNNESFRKLLSFNPTMVRLLHAGSAVVELRNPAFQSHNGAIAALQNSTPTYE